MNGKNQNDKQVPLVHKSIDKESRFSKKSSKNEKNILIRQESLSDEEENSQEQIEEVTKIVQEKLEEVTKSSQLPQGKSKQCQVLHTQQPDTYFQRVLPHCIFLFAYQNLPITNHCKVWIDAKFLLDLQPKEPKSIKQLIENFLQLIDWSNSETGVIDMLIATGSSINQGSFYDSGFLSLTGKEYLPANEIATKIKPPISYGRFYFGSSSLWVGGQQGHSNSTTVREDAESQLENLLKRSRRLLILDQTLQQQYQQLSNLSFLKRIFLYAATKAIKGSDYFDLQ